MTADFTKPTATGYPARHSSGIREVSVRLTWVGGAQTLSPVGIQVLGPMEVDAVRALEPRDRVALGVLVVCHGHAVHADEFAAALWPDGPPSSWAKQIHICIGRLRQAIGASAIETTPAGYRLTVEPGEIDVVRFERDVARARTLRLDGEAERGCPGVRARPLLVARSTARRARTMAVRLDRGGSARGTATHGRGGVVGCPTRRGRAP